MYWDYESIDILVYGNSRRFGGDVSKGEAGKQKGKEIIRRWKLSEFFLFGSLAASD